jgi:ketosteroid isomerase-like protein|tara:strand:+ start:16831 stop:17277 length:447 start_codon:yes stop_codon:yes gene_type:complete
MDWVDIRRTIEAYMFGVDAKDLDALLSCFAPEAEALYHMGSVDEKTVTGGEAIARGVFDSCSRFTASNHCISNFVAREGVQEATTNTFAVAYVVIGSQGLVRGLRYEDSLKWRDDCWLITRRVHTPLWQTTIDVEAPHFFEQAKLGAS